MFERLFVFVIASFYNMAGETMSISDLLGLNSPRGLLGNSFSNPPGLSTPPVAAAAYQVNTYYRKSSILMRALFVIFFRMTTGQFFLSVMQLKFLMFLETSLIATRFFFLCPNVPNVTFEGGALLLK